MKFNRLRLLGFKSFVEPSEFIIERGLTGIVGPNGCGKSNLVEALRWVMGENSYKNMRASGMDDVIFSGSGNRPARNTAEVSLWLDNTDRTAPASFNDSDEIQVSRRIEREAGSVYRINGKEARAKDVQLLFADASTGARSPSMVGQGRIGELIQAKPQARRQLLEEAAGISGLHSRRHEAELRLRAAETNLERLEDVVSQIESQVESLKRQARQANRFRMLSADIRAHEAKLLHLRWVEAKAAEGEAESQLNQLTVVVAERAQEQMEAARQQGVDALQLPDLREEEARQAAALQRLQIARQQMEEDASRLMRRREELIRRLDQLAQDIQREERLIEDNQQIIERLEAEEADILALLTGRADEEQSLREDLSEASSLLSEHEAAFNRQTSERAEALAGRQSIERLLRDLAERRMRLERQVGEAQGEVSRIDGLLASLPDPSERREEVEAATEAVTEAEEEAHAAETRLGRARDGERLARAPLDAARVALRDLETEARTLSRILGASANASGHVPLSDLLTVERGFETALGAALGEDLDSPLDAAAPSHWSSLGRKTDGDPALPSGITPLSHHVTAPPELSRRLAQIGLVSEEQASSAVPHLHTGQSLVSRNGALWRWDGLVQRADAPSAAAERLAQKNRLADLEASLPAARERLEAAEDALSLAADAIAEAEADLATARETVRLRQRGLSEARDRLQEAEKASGDLARRRDVVAESLAQLTSQISDLLEQDDDARRALDDLPDMSGLDLALKEAEASVQLARSRFAEAKARHDGFARENELRQRRLLSIMQDKANWQARAESAEGQIEALRQRESEARDEIAELDDAPEMFDEKRRALMDALTRAEASRREAADRLQVAENRQRASDQQAALALAALAEAREKRGRAEERLVSARERRLETEERIRSDLTCEPHDAFRLAGLVHGAALPEQKDIERELERLRIERERLGAVNLRAEEESRTLSEKLSALIAERDDVIDAIRKLRAAIQSLNREGRERLVAAFDAVNAQFQRLFTHLFGGGTAELQLIESDDPLEAGLEILARPPGKKPQTMTLLSGGEQALTAMALIFAVFLTNPAPICVLDEVDAPLDDHNVERFCNLMDEMAASTETRFIIITHNPITMARMNRLFGVTMAEQGVSQLVSVDLQAAEAMRDAG